MTSDFADLARARLRSEFDTSVLRRTHPRELRRRLTVLTHADGREPVTVDGVTHYGYGHGDTVDAWFAADGRGLVVTFDHTSPLASAGAALYDGVPADLLALAGGTPPATGVFTFASPCAMAEGLVSRLQETGLGIEATGVGRLLEDALVTTDVSTAALEPEPSAPLDPEALDRFYRIWADTGYNDRWDVHYVLFDSEDLDDVVDERDELLRLVETLGLERVDTPPDAATGEVWVRTDPRIDAGLENWS